MEQRILEQSMVIRSHGVVTGWAALRLLGGNFFDGLAPDGVTERRVPVAANGDRIRETRGIDLDRSLVPSYDVFVRCGIRCASPERALFDEVVRLGDLREGTVAVDMAAAARLTSVRRMRAYLQGRAGARGVSLVASTLELADEGSRSPQEVRFRLVWELDAEWGRPLTNRGVLDPSGRLIGIPDLLDPVRGVVGEYDGAEHRGRDRHAHDVRREDLFRRVGLEYVAVVGRDLRDRALVVDRIHAAGRRAGLLPRTWRLAAPGPPLDDALDERDRVLRMHGE